MRKVTASAVILTAITGCSQSEVPSAEWSFDAPENRPLGGELVGQRDESSGPRNDAFTSDASGLFTQSSKAFMGPAGAPTALPPSDPSSPLANVSTSETRGALPIQGATLRTDPLAPVRAYLESTRSISGVTNRVPYSSQVYLPEAPVYTPSIVSSEDIAALSLPEGAPSTVSSVSSAPVDVSAVDTLSAITDFATADLAPLDSALAASTVPVSLAPQSFLSAVATLPADVYSTSINTDSNDSARSRYIEESYIEESGVEAPSAQSSPSAAFRDTLPVLDSAPLDIAPSEPALISTPNEPVSVGTAILRDLAQDGDAEALAALAAVDANVEDAGVEDADIASDAGSIEIFIEPEGSSVETESSPTLEGLLTSMPSREEPSPLISFEVIQSDSRSVSRADDEPLLSELETAEFRLQPRNNSIPALHPLLLDLPVPAAGLLPIAPVEPSAGLAPNELSPNEVALPLESAPISSSDTLSRDVLDADILSDDSSLDNLLPSQTINGDSQLNSRADHSALLASLAAVDGSTVALSTVYVPISEPSVTDVSAAYIREAIASLPRGANSLDPVDELSFFEGELSSQLASAQQGPIGVFETVVRFSEPSLTTGVLAEEISSEESLVEDSSPQKVSRSRKVSSFAMNRRHPAYRQRLVWQ